MRVVSLLPAATEIVAELGAADTLVGVSHECDYPPEITSLPRVTRSRLDASGNPVQVDEAVGEPGADAESLFELDEALVASLRPDLILTQAVCDVCAVREEDVRTLATRLRPMPGIVALSATTLDGVLEDIRAVATALEVVDEAEELLAGMRERMHRVHARLKGNSAPRPRVAVLEWTDPLFAAGHWVPQMVRRAGGVDVLGASDVKSRAVTMDELVSAAPEVLVFAPCGYDLDRASEEARRRLMRPEWGWATRTRVWAMDGNGLVSRPGPRIVTGIEVLAQLLNPSLFPPPLRSRAVAVRDGADPTDSVPAATARRPSRR